MHPAAQIAKAEAVREISVIRQRMKKVVEAIIRDSSYLKNILWQKQKMLNEQTEEWVQISLIRSAQWMMRSTNN
jgi:hypothetical protein